MTDASKPRRRSRPRNDVSAAPTPPAAANEPAPIPIDAANLDEAFVKALEADFLQYGVSAIRAMRAERPTDYMKIVATMRAKDTNDTANPLREMIDDELKRHIEELAARGGYEIRARGAGNGARRARAADDEGADAG